MTGLTQRCVFGVIKRLEAMGYIEKVPGGIVRGRGHSSRYLLHPENMNGVHILGSPEKAENVNPVHENMNPTKGARESRVTSSSPG